MHLNAYIKSTRSSILILLLSATIILLNSCNQDEIITSSDTIISTDCDTTSISYSKDIKPLIKSCLPCHNNSVNFSGVNLDGIENVRENTTNGDLIFSLRYSMNMYFTGNDCDILKIKIWAKNEGLDN